MVRVLLVDDDPGTLVGYSGILRTEGFQVSAACSAADAISQWQHNPPDIALVDLQLPDMSGLELLDTLRQRSVRTPIIIVTGFGSCRSAVEAMRVGAADFVEKPLIGDELVQIVRRGLPRPPAATDEEFHDPAVMLHAAQRWAALVHKILDSQSDVRTLAEWAHHAGASIGGVKASCQAVRVSPRHSLILARLLRALYGAKRFCIPAEDLLDIHDRRTLASWLSLAGVPVLAGEPREFVARQQLVTTASLKTELQRVLSGSRRA
jgi:DNA-binding response OmpR family regulator